MIISPQILVKRGDITVAKVALRKAYDRTEKGCGKDTPLCEQARELLANPPQVVA